MGFLDLVASLFLFSFVCGFSGTGGRVGVFDFTVVLGAVFVEVLVVFVGGAQHFGDLVAVGGDAGSVVAGQVLVADQVDGHEGQGGSDEGHEGAHEDGVDDFLADAEGAEAALVGLTGVDEGVGELPGAADFVVGFVDVGEGEDGSGEGDDAEDDAGGGENLVVSGGGEVGEFGVGEDVEF